MNAWKYLQKLNFSPEKYRKCEKKVYFKMFWLKEIMTPFSYFQVFKKNPAFFKDLKIKKWRHYFLQWKHLEMHQALTWQNRVAIEGQQHVQYSVQGQHNQAPCEWEARPIPRVAHGQTSDFFQPQGLCMGIEFMFHF